MDNRRSFLKKGSFALLALSTSASLFPVRVRARTEMTVTDPKTAAVIWYSQTGNSERTGRLIAETFSKMGLNVTASDYRDFDPESIGTYDLIVAGSPVYYYDVPDDIAYDRMRTYARLILDRVHKGHGIEIEKNCDLRDLIKNSPSIWGTKLFISNHTIDGSKCIQCGTCLKKCPVGAIDLENNHVNTDACIACLGCVNNCPASAVHMEFMGKKVYGYYDFLEGNHIQIHLPEELGTRVGSF